MSQPVTSEPVLLQLWFARISAATREAENDVVALLSASERERLDRIKSETRRREFLLGRALMRRGLSRHFGRDERDWDVVDRERAKPVVANLPAGAFIGLAHSKGLVCFALANRALGIDLEYCRKPRDYNGMAKMFMNDAERERLTRGGVDQADYFYRAWCAKEACYKLLDENEQANTQFTRIDYARLCRNVSGRYLREGRIGEFAVAVVSADKADDIVCNYFPTSAEVTATLVLDDA